MGVFESDLNVRNKWLGDVFKWMLGFPHVLFYPETEVKPSSFTIKGLPEWPSGLMCCNRLHAVIRYCPDFNPFSSMRESWQWPGLGNSFHG